MEETLGKRIASHRKQLKLTQDQLAEQLGVTAQAVSKWENDLSCPDIGILPRLAAIFDTSIDALLGCTTKEKEVVHEVEVISKESEGIVIGNEHRQHYLVRVVFPHFEPCVRLSPHTALHRELVDYGNLLSNDVRMFT